MYCSWVKGVHVCSNIPVSQWNQSSPSGHFEILIHLKIPSAPFMADIDNILSHWKFTQALATEGYNGNIKNYKAIALNWTTLKITFDADSPQIIALVIVLLTLIGLGIVINDILISINKNPLLSGGIDIIAIAVLIGAIVFGFKSIKGGK